MQQLLIACALLLCLLFVYLHAAAGDDGLKTHQKDAHDAATEYIRSIDA